MELFDYLTVFVSLLMLALCLMPSEQRIYVVVICQAGQSGMLKMKDYISWMSDFC